MMSHPLFTWGLVTFDDLTKTSLSAPIGGLHLVGVVVRGTADCINVILNHIMTRLMGK
jgi:hypothetical protein